MTEQDLIRTVEKIRPDARLKERIMTGEKRTGRKDSRFQAAFRVAACAMAAVVLFMGVSYARSAMQPVGTVASSGAASISGPAVAQQKSGVWSVLLLGEDRPTASSMRNNSAVLLSVNDSKKTVLFSFFPCDLYVEIPQNGKGRLGDAYQLGGAELSKKTMEQNFGVTVNTALGIPAAVLTGLMDSLGGVPATLTQEEAKAINQFTGAKTEQVKAGDITLTGNAAYAYFTQSLGSATDLEVTARQQKAARQLTGRLRTMESAQLVEAMRKIIPTAAMSQVKAEQFAGVLQKYQNYEVYGLAPSSALASVQEEKSDRCSIFVLQPNLTEYRATLEKMIGKGDFSAAQRLAGQGGLSK